MILLGLASAFAVDAEGERIAEELVRYAMDGRWNAVEAQYVRLLASHPAEVTGEIHRLGAQSARLEGRLLLSAQRLERVLPGDPAREDAVADRSTLEQSAGLTMVRVRDREGFQIVQQPFNPELKVAVQHATEVVREKGWFVGLLPAGAYRVDGATLTVHPGFDWQVLTTRRGD